MSIKPLMIEIADQITALKVIERSWRDGKQFVPLIGSGISAEVGLPSGSELGEYLAKLRYIQSRKLAPKSHAKIWPTHNQINSSLVALLENQEGEEEAIADLIDSAIRSMVHREFGTSELLVYGSLEKVQLGAFLSSQWRVLLRRVLGGRSPQTTEFLDRLTNRASPGRPQQFLAHLTRFLGWRVLLTTNFDSLIEDAHKQLGLELFVASGQTLPEPEAIAAKTALLKCHGDTSSFLGEDTLDAVPSGADIARFRNYFSPDSVFLVVGYSGHDRRVVSLLSSLNKETDVIWVYRSRPPIHLSNLADFGPRVIAVKYKNASMFFQDIYQWLATAFPAAGIQYRTLVSAPPSTKAKPAINANSNQLPNRQPLQHSSFAKSYRVVVFRSDKNGSGTSTQLTQYCEENAGTHRIIHCDLEKIPSHRALATEIHRELRNLDPELPPLVLRPIGALERLDYNLLHPDDHDASIERIVYALQRGRYIVAIDSMGEFGRAQASHHLQDTPAPDILDRAKSLHEFLLKLSSCFGQYGESILAFTCVPIDVPESTRTAVRRDQIIRLVEQVKMTSIPSSTLSGSELTSDTQTDFDYDDAHKLGVYNVVSQIGFGSFGVVYRVYHPYLEATYAAKLMKAKSPLSDEERLQFLEEGRLLKRLDHPGIVRVSDASVTDDGIPFIISDFIDGCTLRELLDSNSLQLIDKLLIAYDICEALQHAHEQKVVHRDIKPTNILIRKKDGKAIVADFGLAFLQGAKNEARMAGTLQYMSPEQASRQSATTRSDIFSFGLVYYELITGRSAFEGTNPFEISRALIQGRLPTINSSYNYRQRKIYVECTKLRPEDRYESFAKVAEDIQMLIEDIRNIDNAPTVSARLREENGDFVEKLNKFAAESNQEVFVHIASTSPGYVRDGSISILQRILSSASSAESVARRIKQDTDNGTIYSAIKVLWPELEMSHRKTLAVASVFRQPRSLVALRKIGGALNLSPLDLELSLEELALNSLDDINSQISQVVDNIAEQTSHNSADDVLRIGLETIDGVLADLNDAELLLRQEGGYYWMHSDVRDHVYQMLRASTKLGLSRLHELVSLYYIREEYSASHDLESLLEYTYHAIASINHGSTSDIVRRCRHLEQNLRRERSQLLSTIDPERLVDMFLRIRDYELPQITERVRLSGISDDEKRIYEVTRASLLGFVCDLIADIYRMTTSFRSCLEIRCRQVLDRMSEIESRRLLQSKFFDEQFLLRPLNSDHMYMLVERLTEMLSAAVSCIRFTSNSFMRLLAHILDIAKCLQGMHCIDHARRLFRAVSDCAGKAMGKTNGVAFAQGQLQITIGRCGLRMLESVSGPLNIWDQSTDNPDVTANSEAQSLTKLCADALGNYPASDREVYARHYAYLKSLSSRLNAVNGNFTQAYRDLKSATATLGWQRDPASMQTRAICDLRRAECLMLHADRHLTSDLEVSPALTCLSRSQRKLDLAEMSIRRCRETIEISGASVWCWTLMFQQSVQLVHERILALAFVEMNGQSKGIDLENLLLESLSQIGAGLDNVEKDALRWNHFTGLWWQLLICYAVFEETSNPAYHFDRAFGRWGELNRSASLSWFFQHEKRNRFEVVRRSWSSCIDRAFKILPKFRRDFILRVESEVLRQCKIFDFDPTYRHWEQMLAQVRSASVSANAMYSIGMDELKAIGTMLDSCVNGKPRSE